nr:matrix-remodeling-associated protein 7-like [Misgurnus anguillicaudatus]
MDATSDLIWPAVLFTLLAMTVAAVITVKNNTKAPLKCINQSTAVVDGGTGDSSQNNDTGAHNSEILHQSNANKLASKDENVQDSTPDNEEEVCRTDAEEDSSEYGIRNALKDYAQSTDAEEKPLRYMAGMLRSSQLKKMMTKEELEEEQRVQREQLAAIFQLLRDKQDTFGDVTQNDLQEQLQLYSY